MLVFFRSEPNAGGRRRAEHHSGNALALVGNLTLHVLLFGRVPSFPHEKAALIVGLYLLGLAMGFLLEHEAVPFAACVQGAYLVAACLDWCVVRVYLTPHLSTST